MAKIPLPKVTRVEDAKAHPFPIQIGLQTQEFLQGAIFYATFTDLAAGEFVRQQNGVTRIEELMVANGVTRGVPDQAWEILHKYQSIFGGVVFQSVLIMLNSHWDWYIRRLSEFIRYARAHAGGPNLSKDRLRDLDRADHLPMDQQLSVIAEATGISLQLETEDVDELVEMTLVRNLGLHNRWEVDARYISRSNQVTFAEGDLRQVTVEELHRWHALMVRVLNRSALECAKCYATVPEFGI